MHFSFVTSGRKQNWLLTGPYDIRRASSKQPTVVLQQAPSLVPDKERETIHAIHQTRSGRLYMLFIRQGAGDYTCYSSDKERETIHAIHQTRSGRLYMLFIRQGAGDYTCYSSARRETIHAIHHQPAMPQSSCRRDFSDRLRLANQRWWTRHTALSTASCIREFGIISFR